MIGVVIKQTSNGVGIVTCSRPSLGMRLSAFSDKAGIGQQALVADALQFLVRDNPLKTVSTAAGSFLGVDAASPAPFPNRPLGTLKDLRRLGGRVPVLDSFLL